MAEPVLQISGLNVFYGSSHALQGIDLTLPGGVLAVVGRNGMGKTTLCKAVMGLVPIASGTIRFAGEEIGGLGPTDVARRGVGYVPQGRRLWPSLTVDEHLRLARRPGGPWSIERIYDTFPRLADRRDNGGGQLSGGEQQMLAIGRGLLANPRLLVMDEPTEGLAPVIVAQVEDMLVRLADEGTLSVLVIEQNIGVATEVSDTVAIMVNGRINRVIDSATIATDRDLQQRLLGVGRHAHDETEGLAAAAEGAAEPLAPRGPARIYVANPTPPTRWSPPVPVARLEAMARTASARETTTEMAALRPLAAAGERVVLVAGALDTKGPELRYLRDRLREAGLRTRLVDLSTTAGQEGSAHTGADVPAHQVAAYHPRGPGAVFTGDRGRAVSGMAEAFAEWMRRQTGIVGIISAAGSGGTAMATAGMRTLRVGIPKVMISTMASGNVQGYVGAADILMLHSITDVQGLNAISRQILGNGAAAMAGMVRARESGAEAAPARQAVGLTMFGVTTPCV
ncbi:MAG: Tm-1-like ATP-binding domain-containing protein, partial [Acetobacteraceae bacterium]|nr:Tm-1-like ATP-binding domain-containing protein [Acetobacteraceae bacterium]